MPFTHRFAPAARFGFWLRLAALCAVATSAPLALANPAASIPPSAPQSAMAEVDIHSPYRVVPKMPTGTKTTADHSKFKELQGPFKSGSEVTAACLSCHTEAAKQIKGTIHWKWEEVEQDSKRIVGKNKVMNNFCVSTPSNQQFCTGCHVGYGDAKSGEFVAFSKRPDTDVDCLVCHDQTGKYVKAPYQSGNPPTTRIEMPPGSGKFIEPIDLALIAQHVGAPSRANCGTCHFNGGGGDGVKHGDLDSSLINPPKSLDVHMAKDGLNFQCQTCHATGGHEVSGSHYKLDAKHEGGQYVRGSQHNMGSAASCQSCHGDTPHKGNLAQDLNMHTRNIACQTCHIPEFARGGVPTKMEWDYSKAGQRGPDGKPLVIKDEHGHPTYLGIKGQFKLGENVVPDYTWFNGTVKWMNIGENVTPNKDGVVAINQYGGSATDGKSRIWPVKTMKGTQPYDPEMHRLLAIHNAGFDDAAYWHTMDWQKSIAAGMKEAGLEWSGKYEFVKTTTTWPITHMVAPKDKALSCAQCHSNNGRLEKIDGIYVPGRGKDHQNWIETIGLGVAGLSLAGVMVHGGIRSFLWLRRRNKPGSKSH